MSALDASYLSKTKWTGLISILPHRLEKQCQLGQKEFLPLTITNETNGMIAWKIKTNRPERYKIRHVKIYSKTSNTPRIYSYLKTKILLVLF